mgnify:CR=1 FL=1
MMNINAFRMRKNQPTKLVHVYYEVPSLVDKVSDSEYRRIRNSVVPENCFVRHSSFSNQFRTILKQETFDFEELLKSDPCTKTLLFSRDEHRPFNTLRPFGAMLCYIK